jgi:tetratricopeptide (TPR) repeat protein
MPSSARVLKFRRRSPATSLSATDASLLAGQFLSIPFAARTDSERSTFLSDPNVLVAVFGLLRDLRETAPSDISDEAIAIHNWLRDSAESIGLFDERDYFLGEAAFMAGNALRLQGKREDAVRWLDRAEANFRHTINSGPSMANVAYARLAIGFDLGRYNDVVDLVPSLRLSYDRLGMRQESAKCYLLEAMALKAQGNTERALEVLEPCRRSGESDLDSALRGRILAELGDLYQSVDRVDQAFALYQEALSSLGTCEPSQTRADLKLFVGEAYRSRGRLDVALTAFREAAADYRVIGLSTREAYLRLLLADVLLQLKRDREAEWEILSALPTIDEQKMVPEGLAALALLEKSARRRKTDPNALRELREHLQKQN